MDNEQKEKLEALATEAKNKAGGIWTAVKTKVLATWKSGTKGKAICIGGVLLVLMVLGAIFGDEEGDAEGGGREWEYTGKYFSSVFKGFPKDEGVVYQHYPQPIFIIGEVLYPITVMQATENGNLVRTEDSDRVVWVETKRRYEDDEMLDQGYYIRRGSFEYETALGSEKTVARYVQVTDKKMLLKIEKAKQAQEAKEKAEKEAREAKEKAEEEARKKAAEEAAEQGAYELDIPVKSLCGFKLGAPPSQVRDLLQNDDGTPVLDLIGDLNNNYHHIRTYRLAKPFRLFTNATVVFADKGFGMHLVCVTLEGEIDREKTTEESRTAEMQATAELIEKKFGIKFSKDYDGDYSWRDENRKEFIDIEFGYNTLSLKFGAASEVARFDKRAKEEQKTTIQLDANAGADDL